MGARSPCFPAGVELPDGQARALPADEREVRCILMNVTGEVRASPADVGRGGGYVETTMGPEKPGQHHGNPIEIRSGVRSGWRLVQAFSTVRSCRTAGILARGRQGHPIIHSPDRRGHGALPAGASGFAARRTPRHAIGTRFCGLGTRRERPPKWRMRERLVPNGRKPCGGFTVRAA